MTGDKPGNLNQYSSPLPKNGQTITSFVFQAILCSELVGIVWVSGASLVRIHSCSRTFALREVPKCTRAAMALIDNVVSFLNRESIANLAGSLLRRVARSWSFQPNRLNSSENLRRLR